MREETNLTDAASAVFDAIQRIGATFFDDLAKATGLGRTALEDALGELVSWGFVTSDGFAGLRALITPADNRVPIRSGVSKAAPRATRFEHAGRWSLLPRETVDRHEAVECVARALLRRYGVVFRKVLERESTLPAWRELLPVYWRLEARGEIRGGRFVDRFSGEQFALPDAVAALRQTRRRETDDSFVRISAADPLNLVGIVTPGERIPAIANNAVLLRGGAPVAARVGGEVIELDKRRPVNAEIREQLIPRQTVAWMR